MVVTGPLVIGREAIAGSIARFCGRTNDRPAALLLALKTMTYFTLLLHLLADSKENTKRRHLPTNTTATHKSNALVDK